MNILVYESINQQLKLIVNSMIYLGLKPKAVSDSNQIIPELFNAEFKLLLFDCPSGKPELVKIIETIKKDSKISTVAIFIHTSSKDKTFLYELLKIGINGIIFKPFQSDQFVTQFQKALKQSKLQMSERRHIRVQPSDTDKVIITFRNPIDMKLINASIVDISLGGIAFQYKEDLNNPELKANTEIKSAQIKIGDSHINIDLKIITKKDDLVAGQFSGISSFDMNLLCAYIYRKIQYIEN